MCINIKLLPWRWSRPSSESISTRLYGTSSSSESDTIFRFILLFLKDEWEPTDDTEEDLDIDLERDFDFDLDRLCNIFLGWNLDFNLDFFVPDPEAERKEESDSELEESFEDRDLDLDLRSTAFASFDILTLLSSVDEIDTSEEFNVSKNKWSISQ